MWKLRICAGALALALAAGIAGGALGERGKTERAAIRRQTETPALYQSAEAGQGRGWWGVLYRDALLFARAEEAEDMPDGAEAAFVWPLWEWLLCLLGLQ